MKPQLIARLSECFLLSLLALACSGTPDVTNGNGSGVPTAGSSNVGDDDASGDDDSSGDDDDGGPVIVPGASGAGAGDCKTRCEPDECGPIADGCGDIINCGGCDAPETCGGGGEPSRCGGSSACEPKTCEDLEATCGMQADGCGDTINCWADGAEECAEDGAECIDGECAVPPTSCEPLTCDDYDDDNLCGEVTDGCGETLDCGFECADDEICGAQEPGKCGHATCQPTSCESALAALPSGYCGFVSDGCGGGIDNCATVCTGSETCGGGGTADVCGEGGSVCVPRTTADCGTSCGPISDGCGSTVDCGGCTDPETCGGGGTPSECGAPVCVPRDCADFNANCGSIPDGCGDTVDCGGCNGNEFCNANQCQAVVCVPLEADDVCPGFCGMQSDGCGGTVNCGGCTGNNTCGGGGTPSVCGSPPCTPLTCQDVGANCGPIGDGCGGVIASCGTCTLPEICGGGGLASVCGNLTGGGGTCTGFCQNQVTCASGQETRLSGTVYAPNGTEPLYNALVYVPNQTQLPAITTGPSCERCEDEDLGNPIAAALTGADGKFVLRNVPANIDFPLVVKMGKWRRVVTIPAMTQCTNRDLTSSDTRLPRNMNDASTANRQWVNIPKFSIATGERDAMECVLRKIGVSDSEFTLPTGSGRVHMYRENGARMCSQRNSSGACTQSTYSSVSNLFTTGAGINRYDIAIFDCEGDDNEHNSRDDDLHAFAEAGGRVFASHFSYTYLHDNDDFATTATWGGPQQGSSNTTPGIIDTSSTKGQAFNAWLANVNANHPTYGSGYINIQDPRYYVRSNNTNVSERFVYTDDNRRISGVQINERDAVEQYAFNTPVGANADNVCGRVLYSAFHVSVQAATNNSVFPDFCSTGPLTAQEKVLEFMIFDLSACVSVGDPPTPPTCTAKTCQELGATCGYRADGCGGLLDCGTCNAPETCGGGGTPNQCGSSCNLTSCGAEGANCGVIADGCGGVLTCGACSAPAVCGGGGTPNVCGVPSCTPRTCSSVGAECGPISDGCGGTVDCGVCTGGESCGGGGTPNVCGMGSCNPKTCGTENAECGFIGDGCGGVLDCGDCNAPEVCGGGGVPSQCGGSCTPRTCVQANAECGAVGDGCGGVLSCGVCPSGQTCGADGPNQCGAGSCTPRTCSQVGAECGAASNGCGGILDCGDCVAPESCGGAGVPNQCGAGGCVPLTCAQQNADCGPAADGCGGLLDCGVCPTGQTCGGGGIPSKCGSIR